MSSGSSRSPSPQRIPSDVSEEELERPAPRLARGRGSRPSAPIPVEEADEDYEPSGSRWTSRRFERSPSPPRFESPSRTRRSASRDDSDSDSEGESKNQSVKSEQLTEIERLRAQILARFQPKPDRPRKEDSDSEDEPVYSRTREYDSDFEDEPRRVTSDSEDEPPRSRSRTRGANSKVQRSYKGDIRTSVSIRELPIDVAQRFHLIARLLEEAEKKILKKQDDKLNELERKRAEIVVKIARLRDEGTEESDIWYLKYEESRLKGEIKSVRKKWIGKQEKLAKGLNKTIENNRVAYNHEVRLDASLPDVVPVPNARVFVKDYYGYIALANEKLWFYNNVPKELIKQRIGPIEYFNRVWLLGPLVRLGKIKSSGPVSESDLRTLLIDQLISDREDFIDKRQVSWKIEDDDAREIAALRQFKILDPDLMFFNVDHMLIPEGSWSYSVQFDPSKQIFRKAVRKAHYGPNKVTVNPPANSSHVTVHWFQISHNILNKVTGPVAGQVSLKEQTERNKYIMYYQIDEVYYGAKIYLLDAVYLDDKADTPQGVERILYGDWAENFDLSVLETYKRFHTSLVQENIEEYAKTIRNPVVQEIVRNATNPFKFPKVARETSSEAPILNEQVEHLLDQIEFNDREFTTPDIEDILNPPLRPELKKPYQRAPRKIHIEYIDLNLKRNS